MNHFTKLALENLNSIKGQIEYAKAKIKNPNTPKWEVKEFKAVMILLDDELIEANERYENCLAIA